MKPYKIEFCKVNERLKEICRWVSAAHSNNLESMLSENTLDSWYFKNEILNYEKEYGKKPNPRPTRDSDDFDNPYETQRYHLLEMGDGIQRMIYSPDEINWEGGWENSKTLRLHVYEDYWGTKGKEIKLNIEQIKEIANGRIKRVEVKYYKYGNVKIGDSRDAEDYKKIEQKRYEFMLEMIKAFPNGATRKESERFLKNLETKHGNLWSY